MHCVQFESRLNDLLDERRRPEQDRRLVDHARRCPECADLLAGHERLLAGLDALQADARPIDGERSWRPTPAANLPMRVALEVARQRRAERRRTWAWLAPVAVAASLLLALGVWRAIGSNGGVAPQPSPDSLVRDSSPSPHGGASQHASPRFDPSMLLGSAYSDELSQRLSTGVEQLADGLKPVTDSMSAALQALRRTAPSNERGPRSSSLVGVQQIFV